MRDGRDKGGFSEPKGKITMYKLIIKHNTLQFRYTKDFSVSFMFSTIFV